MRLSLSTPALFILYHLQSHRYETAIAGGAVRDILIPAQNNSSDTQAKTQTATTTDYDFTTNATPEQIQAVFPESFYENTFGTVSIAEKHLQEMVAYQLPDRPALSVVTRSQRVIDVLAATKLHESLATQTVAEGSDSETTFHPLEQTYQITTFRTDESYSDHRKPESLTWGTSLHEDLKRRDFTINALALKVDQSQLEPLFKSIPNEETLPATFEIDVSIIDEHQGQTDLQHQIIRTVGDPNQRFHEDALRMLRAIRFCVQLGFEIEPETWKSLQSQAHLITHISAERIRDEFLKMLGSAQPARAIELLDESGLLTFILPELIKTKGVEQGGHHTTDVWTHSLDALATCPSSDPIVRLATLLHDIAKPQTQRFAGKNITFYNHEIIGARMARNIARHLRLSRRDVDRIFALVRYHMFHYQPFHTDAAIRRFMRKVGLENIDDMLDLREADRLGSGARKTSWRLEEMKQRMIDQLHQPMEIKDLAINGHDLMTELQLKPGPILGDLLKLLFEDVLENPDLNTKEHLLTLAQEKLAQTQKKE
jgi:tRNA nucleotidyltransferase (CCA-adding enzyme)